MATVFIVSKLKGDLAIDIRKSHTTAGTPLDAYTKKTTSPGWDNQLWTWLPSSLTGYYFLQNPSTSLVIDVDFKLGTPKSRPLNVNSQNVSANSQFWAFYPGSAGYYFIVNGVEGVIDVKGSGGSGTPLDVYMEKSIPDADNQLWTLVDEKGNSVTPPAPPPPPPPPKFVTS